MTNFFETQIFGVKKVETVIVGAGLAGLEAAHRLGKEGSEVLLVTSSWDTAGYLNYALLKNEEYKEIKKFKKSLIKSLLEKTMRSDYTSDKLLFDHLQFQLLIKNAVEKLPKCFLFQDTVDHIRCESSGFELLTHWGLKIKTKKVVIACGTFIGGVIKVGNRSFPGGRLGELGSSQLKQSLEALGVKMKQKKVAIPALIAATPQQSENGKYNLMPEGRQGLYYLFETEGRLAEQTFHEQEKAVKNALGEAAKLLAPAYTVAHWVSDRDIWNENLVFIGRAAGQETLSELIAGVHNNVSRET